MRWRGDRETTVIQRSDLMSVVII
uniref:Uncharacterized protein n=1 Tax=Rhizophora mucronata TaxID=61149 RepID=A0A2P2NDA6_RHIMU